MEKRTFERIPVSLAADLLSGGIPNEDIITDVSESGLFAIIMTRNVPVDLLPNSKFDISIQLDSQETIYLSCEERWSNTISNGLIKRIGWVINNPPAQYNDLLKSL